MRRCLLPILLMVALVDPAAAAGRQASLLLAGDADSLWLLRSGDGVFDIVAKPLDGDWKWIANDLAGTPTAAAATDGRLHLFQNNPFGYLTYDLDGKQMMGLNPADPAHRPARTAPLAVCRSGIFLASVPPAPATMPGEPSRLNPADLLKLQTLIAITAPGTNEPAATSSLAEHFSAASTVPKGGGARRVNLSVFLNLRLEWRYLTQIPDVPLSRDTQILAACIGGKLYVSISGGGSGNRLLEWDQKRWTTLPLAPWVATAQPLALVTLDNQLVMLAGMPKERSLRLGLVSVLEPKAPIQFITQDGKPLVVSEDQRPMAAAFTGQSRIALLWHQGQELNYATVGLNGTITNPQPLTIFSHPRSQDDGQRVFSYFLWTVLIIILVPMFFFRSPVVPKPFELATGAVPGNLLKRSIAALIDMFPFHILSLLYWQWPQPADAWDQLYQFMQQRLANDATYYSFVTSVSLWVIYGTVMEATTGTTLGKKIARLKVIGDAGKPVSFREALLRNATKIIEMTLIPPLLLVPLFSGNRQRVGDILARTVVIEGVAAPAPQAPPPPDEPEDKSE